VSVHEGPPTISGKDVVAETEKDPWIRRNRMARIGDRFEDAKWKIEVPCKSIVFDINSIRARRKEVMTDYFHFFIVDPFLPVVKLFAALRFARHTIAAHRLER
jgi:hypothetical protein